jgi:hypothetical protein
MTEIRNNNILRKSHLRGGKRSRDKGLRAEREVVNLHRQLGFRCERLPLSGGAYYQGKSHDIELHLFEGEAPIRCELKCRKSGFAQLHRWLSDNHALFLRQDNCDPLIVLPFCVWSRLIEGVRQ